IHPAIGFSNEKMWMYLAEELELSEKKLDDDEFLELLPTPLNVALEWVFSGKITDVKTIIGIMWMKELKFNH
ncbi:MAG: ADP-ribose pyrophosphatase, partial [Candidatus Marinimicrobia bacterium]|nr:ADP-ribose pyrophosphatase [Candidatus Neomarinimicrobiota bacterium]